MARSKPHAADTVWSWWLGRLLPNVLRLELVNDEPFEGEQASPAALRGALERRAVLPGVYEDFCVCVRIAKEGAK